MGHGSWVMPLQPLILLEENRNGGIQQLSDARNAGHRLGAKMWVAICDSPRVTVSTPPASMLRSPSPLGLCMLAEAVRGFKPLHSSRVYVPNTDRLGDEI